MPKITPHWPLWKRRMSGVPYVYPRLRPQFDTLLVQVMSLGPHSPRTMLDAFVSEKFVGSVTSRAKIALTPAPRPPTSHVCQALPNMTSPVAGVASANHAWEYCCLEKS